MIRDPAIASQPNPEIHPSARGRPLRLLLGRGGVQLTLVLGSLVFRASIRLDGQHLPKG